jgi:hypothetical protein
MADKSEDLSPEEKIEQENFLLKSKIITQGGILSENSDLDPEIENMFLKRVMAFEEAEYKPVCEIIGVNPADYPPADTLTKDELIVAFNKLIKVFKKHGIAWGVNEYVPIEVSYRFLTEDYLLSESQDLPADFGWTIDGCDGDCPNCFQADYCKNKDDVWPSEKLDAKCKRRLEEGDL